MYPKNLCQHILIPSSQHLGRTQPATPMKFSSLIETLSAQGHAPLGWGGAPDLDLQGLSQISESLPHTVTYVEGPKYAHYIAETQASVVVIPSDATLQAAVEAQGLGWITAQSPRLLFAHILGLFYQPFPGDPGIHATAIVAPDVVLGEGVAIGAHAVVQGGVTLGDGVCIQANVVIYPQVTVGDRTLLHANCVIHERSQLGSDCVIHSGAVIGAEGFGFVPTGQGWVKMQQSGRVVLDAGVEVGCNSTIDRPALGETRIGANTKIDNLVHIGHGCTIGRNCALAAQVGLAGGVTLGDHVILAGQVGVANQAHIGDGAIASSKSGIHGNVEAGAVVSGYPAIANRLWLKAVAVYNRLPELHKAVKQLERQLEGQRDQ